MDDIFFIWPPKQYILLRVNRIATISYRMRKIFLFLIACLPVMAAFGQGGIVRGRVVNKLNNEPLDYASVRFLDQPYGSYTDSAGFFEIKGIPSGQYNLEVT